MDKDLKTVLLFVEHHLKENGCECLEWCVCGYYTLKQSVERVKARLDEVDVDKDLKL